MIDVALAALRSAAGLGVAGNFAGHPEQAGEAADFANVAPVAAEVPKGMFPWFVPGRAGQLGVFPVTHDEMVLPDQPGVDLQIEPSGRRRHQLRSVPKESCCATRGFVELTGCKGSMGTRRTSVTCMRRIVAGVTDRPRATSLTRTSSAPLPPGHGVIGADDGAARTVRPSVEPRICTSRAPVAGSRRITVVGTRQAVAGELITRRRVNTR